LIRGAEKTDADIESADFFEDLHGSFFPYQSILFRYGWPRGQSVAECHTPRYFGHHIALSNEKGSNKTELVAVTGGSAGPSTFVA
jgi:hypothetical protein